MSTPFSPLVQRVLDEAFERWSRDHSRKADEEWAAWIAAHPLPLPDSSYAITTHPRRNGKAVAARAAAEFIATVESEAGMANKARKTNPDKQARLYERIGVDPLDASLRSTRTGAVPVLRRGEIVCETCSQPGVRLPSGAVRHEGRIVNCKGAKNG